MKGKNLNQPSSVATDKQFCSEVGDFHARRHRSLNKELIFVVCLCKRYLTSLKLHFFNLEYTLSLVSKGYME